MMLDDLKLKHEICTATWRQSSACTDLVSFCQHTLLNVQGLKVDSCIWVGVGTLAGNDLYCDRSMGQVAVLETILDELRELYPAVSMYSNLLRLLRFILLFERKKPFTEISLVNLGQKYEIWSVFAQEPALNSLDVAFLRSRGFNILTDPEAQNHMSNTSLLFAPGCEGLVIEQCFEIAYPAILVFTQMEDYFNHTMYESSTLKGSNEEQERAEMRLLERKKDLALYQRVYEPFCKMCSSRSVVTELDGWTEAVYWRESNAKV